MNELMTLLFQFHFYGIKSKEFKFIEHALAFVHMAYSMNFHDYVTTVELLLKKEGHILRIFSLKIFFINFLF